MLVKYTGRKNPIHMTRPEQEEDYIFEGGTPVEVTEHDAEFFLGYPNIFSRLTPAEEKGFMDDTIFRFVAKIFPGKSLNGLDKKEIEKKCMDMTGVNLNRTKSVKNMIKDFMAAV